MRNAVKHKWIFAILLLSGWFITACEEPPARLTLSERNRVDSLYRQEMKELRPYTDSICKVRRDSLVTVFKDSILNERIEKITRQLQRINEVQ